MASPRGQARAPKWHGGDVALTWMHVIFNMYIGLSCIGRQSVNSAHASSSLFSPSGTKVPVFSIFSGHVEQRGSPDEDHDDRMT